MLICKERKIGIFYVNKVGSTTLYDLFKTHTSVGYGNDEFGYNVHDHLNISFAPKESRSFKFYAFYRNPVNRFLSNVDETLKHGVVDKNMTVSEFISKSMDSLLALKQKNLNEVISTKINPRKIKNPLDRNLQISISHGGYFPQTFWLNHDDTDLTMLDFSDFDNQVRFLFKLFDVELPNEIPNKNTSTVKRIASRDDIQFINELYSEDYDFFESKGIKFL